jgi:hypothetical protein
MQMSFNPIDYGFEWTADGWYKWDSKAAHAAALRERNAEAKRYAAQGRTIRKWSNRNQLISRGGIGSGRPHIEEVVTVYGFNVD